MTQRERGGQRDTEIESVRGPGSKVHEKDATEDGSCSQDAGASALNIEFQRSHIHPSPATTDLEKKETAILRILLKNHTHFFFNKSKKKI